MTPEILDEAAIRARVEAATEGPWFGAAGGLHVYGATPGDQVAKCRRRADADFVRHARTDLPAALDEITRLRAALDDARAEFGEAFARGAAWAAGDDEHSPATLLARAEAAESALAAVRALADRITERVEMLSDRKHYSSTADGRERNTWILAERELRAALATPTTTDEGDDR